MSVPQLNVYINGPIAISADQLNTFVQTAQTAAQARTIAGVSGMQISLQGISVPNDGLGGEFYWNGAATAADDNLNVLVPNPGISGAWLRVTDMTGTSDALAYETAQRIAGDAANAAAIASETAAREAADETFAPLNSPHLTGTPTTPTPNGSNPNQIVDVAYVLANAGVQTTFTFTQSVPAANWTINHNLGRFPSIEVVDSSGNVVEGNIDYVNANTITASFTGGFAGLAYLN